METTFVYELIGYIASVLIAVSLMMSNIIKLRVVNLVGAAAFCLYGVLILSVPVAAMNGFIVLINIYYLTKIYFTVEYFQLLKVSAESEYLKTFLKFYEEQIEMFQPGYQAEARVEDLNLFILRDMIPAGLLIGNLQNSGKLIVELDFVVPQYRDFKVGKFIFEENADFFRDRDVYEIIAKPGNKKHNHYLEEMGFSKAGEEYKLPIQ